MDAFNYLWVMVSIVLGLGLTQLFAGIGNLVQIRRRVKLYWLHSLWVLLLVGLHLHMWWSFWALRGIADWSYGAFVYILFGPMPPPGRCSSSRSWACGPSWCPSGPCRRWAA